MASGANSDIMPRSKADGPTLGDAALHAPAPPDHRDNDTPSKNRND